MKLTVVWHKPCWPSPQSPTGFAALGGLPLQIEAVSELFDSTRVVGPRSPCASRAAETPIAGNNVTVVPLGPLPRSGLLTWLVLPIWSARNAVTLTREISRADVVFPLIPSPIGMLGLVVAVALRKRVVTRQLNSWSDQRLLWRAERRFLERIAGRRTVVFATGGAGEPPSTRNASIRWLFSSTVSEAELAAHAAARRLEPRRRPRILVAGREVDVEGTLLVARALQQIANDFPDVTLDVVGNGDALSKARALMREIPLGDRVTFHGPLDRGRLFELLRQADLLCLAGIETEASRQAVHEALACGLPLVAARTSILPMIAEADCGAVVDERTPEALADAVRSCLRDRDEYGRMSANAVLTAAVFTLERWCDVIASALEQAWGPLRCQQARGAGVADSVRVEAGWSRAGR
jgi:glycosyltransferase involved in cell wall biosynthesis